MARSPMFGPPFPRRVEMAASQDEDTRAAIPLGCILPRRSAAKVYGSLIAFVRLLLAPLAMGRGRAVWQGWDVVAHAAACVHVRQCFLACMGNGSYLKACGAVDGARAVCTDSYERTGFVKYENYALCWMRHVCQITAL